MTDDPLQNVTRLIAEAVQDPGDVGTLPGARDEAIERLAEALRDRARRRRRRRSYVAVATAAALVVAVGTWILRSRPSGDEASSSHLGRVEDLAGALTVVRDGRPSSLGATGIAPEGTELQTPVEGEANLVFASGTKLTMHGGTRVRLIEQSKRKRFVLDSGSLDARVAKLGPDERFLVATVDSEIEVHGTQFRVSVVSPEPTCEDGTSTRLIVTEGVVSIRHAGKETFIAAGEFWPRCTSGVGARPHEPSGTAHDGGAIIVPTPSRPRTSHRSSTTSASPTGTISTLTEQNELYGQAMRERREGRPEAAAATLERLLALYPDAALAESARLQRMRALATVDHGRAVDAANDYLRRYPTGFGRTEAEALASGTR